MPEIYLWLPHACIPACISYTNKYIKHITYTQNCYICIKKCLNSYQCPKVIISEEETGCKEITIKNYALLEPSLREICVLFN